MNMDMETGEHHRDDETGELIPVYDSLNLETGEIELILNQKRKPFKIPSEFLPKKRGKQVYQPHSTKDWSPAFLFLLPTLFVYPAITSIIIAILEVILHVWAHKMNKKLENKNVYFKSPMHIIASEFCAKCRDVKSMDKIEKLQDKRILRFKYNYEYVKRIVT